MPTNAENESRNPQKPTFTETLQLISGDEVRIVTPLTGEAKALFDKTRDVSITGNGVTVITLKTPALISRIAIAGNLNGMAVSVTDLTGVVTLLIGAYTNALGYDSGNFAVPIMASSVTITLPAPVPSTMSEVMIYRILEVKANVVANVVVDNTPDKPLFIQAQQQVVNEEANVDMSGFLPAGQVGSLLLDKDLTTGVTGVGIIAINLTHPKLVGRVQIAGNLSNIDVDLALIDGTTQNLVTGYSNTSGYDSGNFDPVTVLSVMITAGGKTDSTLNEVVIEKVIEVKANLSAKVYVDDDPANPLFVQLQQQIVNEEAEVIVKSGGFVNTPPQTPPDYTVIFDKDNTTYLTGSGTLQIKLTHPKLIGRVAIDGTMVGLNVQVIGIDGSITTLVNISPPTEVDGWDSGNFTPIVAVEIDITVDGGNGSSSIINEVVIFKVIEVKGALQVNATPEAPIQVQAEQQLTTDEINMTDSNVYGAGTHTGTVADLFDKDMTTGVEWNPASATDGVYVLFKMPKLISRITLRKLTSSIPESISIAVTDVEGINHTVYPGVPSGYSSLDGVDTGNFKPIMAISIMITIQNAPQYWSLSEITVLKAIETKTFPFNTPADPLYTQLQQQLVLGEVTIQTYGTGWQGDPENIMDKDSLTSLYSSGDGRDEISVVITHPKLIGRIAIQGAPLNIVDMYVVDVTGETHDFGPIISENGYDSGNFPPMMATEIVIVLGGPTYIQELVVLKVIETKIKNDSGEPIFVQDDQAIVNEEIDWTSIDESDVTPDPALPGLPDGWALFDKNPNTEIAIGNSGYIQAEFKKSQLISRFVIRGTFVSPVTLGYIDVLGNLIPLNTDVTDCYDSGNMSPPVMAIGFYITCGAAGSAEIFELTMVKTFETKVSQSPAAPLQVEAEQQVVTDEIDLPESNATNPTNLSSTDWSRLFKKDVVNVDPAHTIIYTYPPGGPASTIHIVLKEIKLISRIAFAFFFGSQPTTPLVIKINKIDDNNPVTVYSAILPDSAPGADTGNFEPVPIWSIDIELPDANMVLQELAVYKTIETKAALNRTASPEATHITGTINAGETRGPTMVLVPPTSNLSGLGVYIEKEYNRAINAEIVLTSTGDEVNLSADVHWFYSYDNVTFFYFATTQIRETPAADNPSNYTAVGEPCYRQIAAPEGAYNKYIAMAVKNNDASELLVVILKIVKQR